MSGRAGVMVAVFLTACALVLGCGDDDGSSNDPVVSGGAETISETSSNEDGVPPVRTSSLSKDEYVQKASAGCTKVRKGLTSKASAYISKVSPKGTSEAVIIAKLGKELIVPTVEAEMAVIQKLGAPVGDEEEIEAILAADQQAIDQVKELKKASSIEDVLGLFSDATKAIKGYGFKACTN